MIDCSLSDISNKNGCMLEFMIQMQKNKYPLFDTYNLKHFPNLQLFLGLSNCFYTNKNKNKNQSYFAKQIENKTININDYIMQQKNNVITNNNESNDNNNIQQQQQSLFINNHLYCHVICRQFVGPK